MPKRVFVSGHYAYVAAYKDLSIIDISNPSAPAQVGNFDTPLNADVYVSGNYAYVAASSSLLIINVTNPASPALAGSYTTTGYACGVYVSGNYAYFADNTSLKIINVTNPANPALTGSYATTAGYARSVYVSGNYAYLAGGNSLKIIDVTNPANPTIAGSYATAGDSQRVYVSGNYAYIADGYWGKLQIINVTNPASPALAGNYALPGEAYDVYVSGNYAYVAGDADLQIINITNPASPTLAGSYATAGGYAWGVYVSGNYAYLAHSNNTTFDNNRGLQIINVSNPASPTLSGNFSYGSLLNAFGSYASGNYAYVTDANSGLQIINITNPANPIFTASFASGAGSGIYVSGNYAYVANGGLSIINVANPANPVLAGSYGISDMGMGNAVFVSGNYAYLAAGIGARQSSGVFQIINVSNLASPALVWSYSMPDPAVGVSVSGNYAYVANMNCSSSCNSGSLNIFNVTNPASPTLAASLDVPGGARGVYASGNYAYVAANDGGLKIYNVTNPASPTLAASYAMIGATHVSVSGNYAYVAVASGLQVINVTNPANPTLAGSYNTPGWGNDVSVSGNRAYMADYNSGLFILDFTGGSYGLPPVVSGCAFSPVSIAAGGTTSSTLQCNVTDANNNLSSVSVNLLSIGGSSNAALTNTTGNTWRLTGITAPATATVRTNYPQITAIDSFGGQGTSQAVLIVTAYVPPPNPKPVVSACGFTPYRLAAGGATTSTLQCTVTDANGNLATVTADLSSLGGSAAAAMTNTSGNTWQKTGITAAANSTVGTNYPKITGTDALGATGTSQATMIVYDPAPVVSGCSFTPNRLPAGGVTSSTLQCTVNDPNNNVTSVTVDLSSIGGSAAAALTNTGGNTWRLAGITASAGSTPQTNYPTITATDSHAGTGTSRATLIVYDPAPVVSSCGFSPVSIKANGVAVTAVQCTVNDPNNNVATVTVNLTAIGGPAAAALTNTGGNTWRRAGITASIGTPAGTKYPATTATDAHAGTGSQAATLIITP